MLIRLQEGTLGRVKTLANQLDSCACRVNLANTLRCLTARRKKAAGRTRPPREAFEEAGAVGRPDKRPVGVYPGRKRINGSRIRCHIEVYPLPVSPLKANWPESAKRVRKWFDVKKAAALVDEPGLESLILAISGR